MQRHLTYKYKVIHSGDIPSVIQRDVAGCVAFFIEKVVDILLLGC